MQTNFKQQIPVTPFEQPILECLSMNTGLSKQRLKHVMQNGAVWLETSHGINRVRRAKKIVKQGETIHIYYDAHIQDEKPLDAILIADESDYSIWDKPAGMYSQGSKWGDHCTIYRWAETKLKPQRPAFIVHRLDRAANGLMILAHKKSVATQFSKMFARHEIYKKYNAQVEGMIDELSLPFEINQDVDGKPAISEILALKTNARKNTTEVEIVIKTGRKHQIRKHLANTGYPIVGDRLYGAINIEQDLQLRSVCLEFICPVTLQQKKYEIK